MNIISSFRASSATLCTLFSALLALGLVSTLTACGGGDDIKDGGSLINLTVDPEASYPEVEVEVTFGIEADDGFEEQDFSWRVDFGDSTTQSGEGISGEARHRYSRTGEFTIRVDALHEGDIVDTQDLTYVVYDPVDLGISSVTGQPTNLQVGENITVSSTLQNQTAGRVFTPFTIRAYLSEDPNVSREEIEELPVIGDSFMDINEEGVVMEGGATRNVGITSPVPTVHSGQYYVVVVVDPEGQIADTNLDDNMAVSANRVRIENVDEALPDISVNDLEVIPDRAFPELNRVTRAFSLTNLGSEDVFNVVYRTYLQIGSSERDDSAQLVHTSSPVNLAAGQERNIGPEEFILSEAIQPPTDGELEVYVIVEAFSEDGDVEEARTTNNIAFSDPPIVVSDQPVVGPDIAVNSFEVSPLNTFIEGSLQIEATIANEGTDDVNSFFCGIYMGPEPRVNIAGDPRLTNINIPSLAAGGVREVSRTFTIPALYDPGIYYFYIVCDPNGALNEPFRGNNQLVQLDAVTITNEADIDLYVDEVTLPSTADDGDLVEVQARICVSGSNATGSTTGELYINAGGTVDFDAAPAKTFTLPNINPGDCLEQTFEVEALCQDFSEQLAVGIYVDSTESLPEDNRTNNKGVADSPIAMNGLYCSCEPDGFAPNQRPLDAYDLVAGEYQAALCQADSCDFYAVSVSEGESLVVTTEFDSSRGHLETTMYAPGGSQPLDSSSTTDVQEVGVFLAGSNRRYIFAVCGDDPTVRNYYDLDVEVLPQPENVDVLPRNIGIPPQDSFSVGTRLEIDARIYNIGQEATGNFEARIALTQEREIGGAEEISIAMVDINSLSSGSFRDVTMEAVIPPEVSDGEYYLAVDLDPSGDLNEDNTSNNAAFSRKFSVETRCFDAFTPNDSFSLAAPLSAGSYSNLVACAGGSDYYEICAPNGHAVSARALFDDSDGDIDMTLYNQHLEVIDTSAQSGVDVEEVNVDYVNGDQCYYLRVFLVSLDSSAENTYQLQLDIDEVPPELQCDPIFEPNDDFDTATSLWAALQHGGTLNRCPVEDTDFFSVQLSPQSTVDFRAILDPAQQPGTLRLQLYRPNGTVDRIVESAPGVPVAEIANYQPPTTGLYHLQVTVGGDERRVTYRLEADGLPGVDLAAENLSIGPGSYWEGESIRYGFDLRNYGGDDVSGIEYKVYLGDTANLNQSEDQLLGLFSAPLLGADESVEINGQVSVPAGHDIGTHYLHVIVDPDDELGDVNRNNNIDTVSVELIAPPEE